MSEFQPVVTKDDLDRLDQDDIVAGYMEGLRGDGQEPGSDKSRGFWHGWRNGMTDSRRKEPDVYQALLIRSIYPNIGPKN